MPESARRIAAATAISLGTAVVVLVTAVLPAELGLDPLGTGKMLGLLGLAGEPRTVVTHQEAGYRSDEIEFVLAPFESVEYKYRIERGASMLFSWSSDHVVVYDLHAEPEGAEPGYAESFDRQRGERAHGTYTAPFSGIHGWFWENRGQEDATIRLTTAGYYGTATVFRDGQARERSTGAVDTPIDVPEGR